MLDLKQDFQFFPSCFERADEAVPPAPALHVHLSILSQLLLRGRGPHLRGEAAQLSILSQLLQVLAGEEGAHHVLRFQFFPSCFQGVAAGAEAALPLSILSQLLRAPGGRSAARWLELSILSQLLPSSAECTAPSMSDLSILSQLLPEQLSPSI